MSQVRGTLALLLVGAAGWWAAAGFARSDDQQAISIATTLTLAGQGSLTVAVDAEPATLSVAVPLATITASPSLPVSTTTTSTSSVPSLVSTSTPTLSSATTERTGTNQGPSGKGSQGPSTTVSVLEHSVTVSAQSAESVVQVEQGSTFASQEQNASSQTSTSAPAPAAVTAQAPVALPSPTMAQPEPAEAQPLQVSGAPVTPGRGAALRTPFRHPVLVTVGGAPRSVWKSSSKRLHRGVRPRRAVVFRFVLRKPQRVQLLFRGPAPSCVVADRLTLAGHKGLNRVSFLGPNRVSFAGRVGRVVLAKGVYAVTALRLDAVPPLYARVVKSGDVRPASKRAASLFRCTARGAPTTDLAGSTADAAPSGPGPASRPYRPPSSEPAVRAATPVDDPVPAGKPGGGNPLGLIGNSHYWLPASVLLLALIAVAMAVAFLAVGGTVRQFFRKPPYYHR